MASSIERSSLTKKGKEQIKTKTFERYKDRQQDTLIYRSVTYADESKPTDKGQDLVIEDNNLKKELKIKKMAQKFKLDPSKPADSQIRKTVFNMETGEVVVNYHFSEG